MLDSWRSGGGCGSKTNGLQRPHYASFGLIQIRFQCQWVRFRRLAFSKPTIAVSRCHYSGDLGRFPVPVSPTAFMQWKNVRRPPRRDRRRRKATFCRRHHRSCRLRAGLARILPRLGYPHNSGRRLPRVRSGGHIQPAQSSDEILGAAGPVSGTADRARCPLSDDIFRERTPLACVHLLRVNIYLHLC